MRRPSPENDNQAGLRRLGVPDRPLDPVTGLRVLEEARVTCVGCRLWTVGADWSIPSRTLPDDFLFLPLAGALELELGGRRHLFSSGRLALVPVGEAHAVRHQPGHRHLTVLAIHLLARDPTGAPLLIGSDPAVLPLARRAAWEEALLDLAALHEQDPKLGAAWGAPLLRLLLAELVRDGLRLRPAVGGGDARLVPVLARLHEHPEQEHRLPELARLAGLRPVRFRALFRAATGSAPKPYLDRLRLSRAAGLLRSGNDPVATVARLAGFHSSRHFLARFHAAYGVSPSAWRSGKGGPGP